MRVVCSLLVVPRAVTEVARSRLRPPVGLFIVVAWLVLGCFSPVAALPTVDASTAAARSTFAYDGEHYDYDQSAAIAASLGTFDFGQRRGYDDRANPAGARSASAPPILAAEEGLATEAATGGAARGPSFIVHPSGEAVPVPEGATGPTPVRTGKGFQFTGGSGGHGLDPRVTDVRVMDPVTTGKYQYPNGYVSYSNRAGQAVNPYTGQTLSRSDPWWHWAWGQ